MKKVEIEMKGRKYPCRATMGALLDFKRETGREATEIGEKSLTDLVVFVWCCIKSACRADGVEFQMSLDEFADGITLAEATAMFEELEV